MNKWSLEETRKLCQIWEKKSRKHILQIFSNRSWQSIRRKSQSIHLSRLRKYKYDYVRENLSKSFREDMDNWLIGEMLGDGHIDRQGRYCHTCKFKEHLDLLSGLFAKYNIPVKINKNTYKDKRTNNTYQRYLLRSPSIFQSARKKWYNNKKICPYIKLDTTILFHWFLGDGTISKKGSSMKLCTMGFYPNCLNNLVNYCNDFGLTVKIQKDNNFYIPKLDNNKKIMAKLTDLSWPTCYAYKLERLKMWLN
jgi:DNA-binding transcriptional regulator WhiA